MTTEQNGVGVIGGGTMGVGIAYVFAAAGFDTIVIEPDPRRREALLTEIARACDGAVSRGKLSDDAALRLRNRVVLETSVGALPAELALVVETVPEQLELKRRVLAEAEDRRPLLLASNTSAISIDVLAEGLDRPDQFLGMHFFNPVWSLPLVEIVRGAKTSPQSIERCRSLVGAIGKQDILVRNLPGFATSRLDMSAALEAMRMLQDGVASAEDIDRAAVLAYRHPVGPLRLSDIVGLDVRLDIARTLAASYGARFEPPQILIDKVNAGHLGRKTGRGFHSWDGDEVPASGGKA